MISTEIGTLLDVVKPWFYLLNTTCTMGSLKQLWQEILFKLLCLVHQHLISWDRHGNLVRPLQVRKWHCEGRWDGTKAQGKHFLAALHPS